MLFGEEAVLKNISIAILERLSRCLLRPEREREIAAEQVGILDIPPPRIETPLRAFSGSNQEKVALGCGLTLQ
jgi:ribose transport system ATP-binding protein